MNRYGCKVHGHPSKVNCPKCHPKTSTAPLEARELLAHRLMMFLGVNDVETYTSEKGYRFKKVTIRPCYLHGEKPWQIPTAKEDAA